MQMFKEIGIVIYAPHRGQREFTVLAGAALSVLEIPFARLEACGAGGLIFGIFPGILRI